MNRQERGGHSPLIHGIAKRRNLSPIGVDDVDTHTLNIGCLIPCWATLSGFPLFLLDFPLFLTIILVIEEVQQDASNGKGNKLYVGLRAARFRSRSLN